MYKQNRIQSKCSVWWLKLGSNWNKSRHRI